MVQDIQRACEEDCISEDLDVPGRQPASVMWPMIDLATSLGPRAFCAGSRACASRIFSTQSR
ncbi:MAG: hypothetical protein AUH30_20670 [Candidatus Rokubacteria bacterium 13_1_40CM_68_15]|nr:MAG: hypothetical protein AUH30_20670 [Candidatus Rokubacteria bacterium 13_1_40CM_68_15]